MELDRGDCKTSLALSAAITALGTWSGTMVGGASVEVLHVVHLILSFGLITLLFGAIFKVLPRAQIEWREVWVGAALTSLLFTVGKFLMGLYLGSSGVANVYGAAGSLVLIILWV